MCHPFPRLRSSCRSRPALPVPFLRPSVRPSVPAGRRSPSYYDDDARSELAEVANLFGGRVPSFEELSSIVRDDRPGAVADRAKLLRANSISFVRGLKLAAEGAEAAAAAESAAAAAGTALATGGAFASAPPTPPHAPAAGAAHLTDSIG
jgi:hypothetical protein